MRPALQRLFGSPSALTIIRNAIDSPHHASACRSSRDYGTKEQSSASDAAAMKSQPAAPKGVSAAVLSFVTGEFRKKRQAAKEDFRSAMSSKPGVKKEAWQQEKVHVPDGHPRNRPADGTAQGKQDSGTQAAKVSRVKFGTSINFRKVERKVDSSPDSRINQKQAATFYVKEHYSPPVSEREERLTDAWNQVLRDAEDDERVSRPDMLSADAKRENIVQNRYERSGQEEITMADSAADSHTLEPIVKEEQVPSSRSQTSVGDTSAFIEAYHSLSKEAKSQQTSSETFSVAMEDGYATTAETVNQDLESHSDVAQTINGDEPIDNERKGRKRIRSFAIKKVAVRPYPIFKEYLTTSLVDKLAGTAKDDVQIKEGYQARPNFRLLSKSSGEQNHHRSERSSLARAIKTRETPVAGNLPSIPKASSMNFVQQAEFYQSHDGYEQDVDSEAYREVDIESSNLVGPARRVERHQTLLDDKSLATSGPLADRLWHSLLDYGFSKEKTKENRLSRVLSHAVELREETGKTWAKLYFLILLRAMKRKDVDTIRWHDALYPTIQPTREEFLELVKYGHRSAPQQISTLQNIYRALPFQDLYTPVMRYLYGRSQYGAAARWHQILVARMDVPEDSQDYRPLFQYMVLYGRSDRLAELVRQMLDQQIPLPNFIKRRLPHNPMTREVVDQQLAVAHGISAKPNSDNFHARLFATRWFSTETVINILRLLGIDTIGPASLRELALREQCDPRAIQIRIEEMKDIGIVLADSTFCKVIERLLREENTRLLESVVNCDLHPDTFEDQDLQESLLDSFYRTGLRLEFDRTLAILLASQPEKYHTGYHCNIQLRLYLRQRDLPAIATTLQMMQASRLPLAIKTVHYVRIALLSRRRVGMRPRTTKELSFIINIWQSVLRLGGNMPANVWVEILKRLGMTGRLEDYENLALWLAEWYSSSPARAYLGGLLKPPRNLTSTDIDRSISVPKFLRSHHRNHPLHVLFPEAAQQAIVAWGFQHSRIGGSGWRWGLYLLLKLKQRKVHIKEAAAAKACRLRLQVLFGSGSSFRPVNRRARARNAAQLDYYIEEMEKIGGRDFIRNTEWRSLQLLRDN